MSASPQQNNPRVIAVASGKGGTGKTTVSLNLARTAGAGVRLLDCDVEEPNAHLFLKAELLAEETAGIPVPRVDPALCDGCGECARFCAYNALACFDGPPLVFQDMCHGCGGCMKVCPRGAITEKDHRIGAVETLQAGDITLVQGRLDVGRAMAPPLIHAVKRHAAGGSLVIMDAPPGTSCPVIATLRDADVVVLVTEPTPFGLNDLALAVDTVRTLGRPFGVVVNRMGSGDNRVHDYCARENVPVYAEIPDDRRIAEAYSCGELLVDALPEYRPLFAALLETALARAEGAA